MNTKELQSLTPSERTVMVLFNSRTRDQLTLAEMATLTGSSAATLADAVHRLAKAGKLIRTRVGNVSRYHAPIEVPCTCSSHPDQRCQQHFGIPMPPMGWGE
jgi:seryl-tRNA(Sec) selenium transferase